ncbi:hypothetical protein ACET3Z_020256 [Daucus carota]
MEILHFSCLRLFLVCSMFITTFSVLDPISVALLNLKSELIDGSDSLSDWFKASGENPPGKIHACGWTGVICNNNSTVITGLDLSMKNLGGEISRMDFDLLNDLVGLNISYNLFSGELPEGIFDLTNLEVLDFSRNNFSGEFPKGIFKLKSLVTLDAFSNSFSGELPVDVSEISTLKVLNFAGSYFSGPIPSEYGSFQSLEFIHLAGNYLSGSLPSELGRLKTLTHMEIGYNSYQGSIPWQFGNMSELQYLDIAGANLSGSLPNYLSNLTKLHTLFLFRNKLSGQIPYDFSKIQALTSLDLSDNLLSGPIPHSFSELQNLRLLSLMYNGMTGSVPEGIAKLKNLDTLLIWNNYFSGSVPQDLGRFSELKWVDVSTNNLVGLIPPDICASGQLTKLILFSNNFSGELSPINNCSSLVRLRIENNSFSGSISLNFNKLSDITYIDLSRNRFTGGIPAGISQALKLQYFNVSSNLELGGIIPGKIWSMPSIQNFSASSCNITGNIPPFHSCKSLSVIELNTNRLSSTVPTSIVKCGSLKLLNISFNDISGSIPSEKVFKSMDSSSFVGNPNLCGAPLRQCLVARRSKRTQKIAWILITCAAVVLLLTLTLFGILYRRRGSQGQWKMISYRGLPQFTANDVLKSFNSTETMEIMPALSGSICKAVLPTGITVLVKKFEWETKRSQFVLEFINTIGNARHKNLTRLLGCCYNNNLAYLLYEYLPNGNLTEKLGIKRDWAAKSKIVTGIAKGLCFLHHDCSPALSHGDLKANYIILDENMEPRLAEYGFKHLAQLNAGLNAATIHWSKKDEFSGTIKEDIFSFGEIVLEIITDGRLRNAGEIIRKKQKEIILKEIYAENEAESSKSLQEEINLVTEIAWRCTTTRSSDRPSMQDVLKLLSGLK